MIRKFLLADDDEDDSDLFQEALAGIDNSIEVEHAQNGAELISKLQTDNVNPHLIFLDINMPVMNGWECLSSLKQINDFKDIPVIMYSTSSADIYGKKAVSEGALGFYEKPTDFLHLKNFLSVIAASSPQNLKTKLMELQKDKTHKIYIE